MNKNNFLKYNVLRSYFLFKNIIKLIKSRKEGNVMENLDYIENPNFISVFMKAIAVSMICSLLFIFILAFLVSNTSLKENIINPSVIFISSISILVGGFLTSKKIKKKGILCGALVGFFYMLIMYIVSSLMNMNFLIDMKSIMMIGFGVLGGAIGGILGVNI